MPNKNLATAIAKKRLKQELIQTLNDV
jgi:hypothetical protein